MVRAKKTGRRSLRRILRTQKEEEKALISVIREFRRTKADPIAYAECYKRLRDIYGSIGALTKKIPVGFETARILIEVTKLPQKIKQMVARGEILLTVAFEIVPFKKDEQIGAAQAVAGLPYKDAVKILRYSKKTGKNVHEARKDILESRLIVVKLPVKNYDFIEKRAVDISEFVKKFVNRWIREGYPSLLIPRLDKETDFRLITVRLPRKNFRVLERKSKDVEGLVRQIVLTYLKRELVKL